MTFSHYYQATEPLYYRRWASSIGPTNISKRPHGFLISSIGKSFSFKFVMIHSIVLGCSAEGHVSSVFSERMSSRPMGWSETGSDRMCRLRCFIRNYGREKVIDLVSQRKRYTEKQREVQRYAEALHGTLSGISTVRKNLAIREQIGNI